MQEENKNKWCETYSTFKTHSLREQWPPRGNEVFMVQRDKSSISLLGTIVNVPENLSLSLNLEGKRGKGETEDLEIRKQQQRNKKC